MQSISFALQQFVITAGDRKVRVAGDLPRQSVAAVVKIGRAHALHIRQRERGGEHAGTFHADTDDGEAQLLSGCGGILRGQRAGVQKNRAGGGRAGLQKLTSRGI